jgi:hypothetical protein
MNSRLYWTFAITSLALFAFTLDRLVVAIALPAIRTDLGALAGVALGSAGLSGVVWAVIRAGAAGWTSAETSLALGGGVALLALFVGWEMRTPAPMLPMRFFRSRVFTAGSASGR